jgi:RHS repeat-associated protein
VFRYTGQVALPGLRLMYYKARMYDPALGRFLQTDPAGYSQGLNLYAYVANNYPNATDPSGMDGNNPFCIMPGDFSSNLLPQCETVQGQPQSWCAILLCTSYAPDESLSSGNGMGIRGNDASNSNQPANGTNGSAPTPCDESDLSDYYDLWKFGGTAGEQAAWFTGLSWSAARYSPLPQVKTAGAIGTAIGGVFTGASYLVQGYAAVQIYRQTGNASYAANSAIGAILDRTGLLERALSPLGSGAASPGVDSALDLSLGSSHRPSCPVRR